MLKVVFFGTPQFAVPYLERLLDHSGIQVIGVVTQPDKRRGRGSKLIPSAVKKVAIARDLPVWQPKRIKKASETLAELEALDADIFAVVAYGQILSKRILEMPRLGCVNGHGSLLPKYRGAAPIQWSIVNSEPETGMTTMLMDEGMDTGAMLLKAVTPITLWMNAHDLAVQLASSGAELLVETLLKLEKNEIKPEAQDHDAATYAPLITKEDFILDWQQSAIALHNKVRGFYPGCVSTFRGQKLKVLDTVPITPECFEAYPAEFEALKTVSPDKGNVGQVVAIVKKLGAIVQTGNGLILLKQVQPAGKKAQSGWDFVNGQRIELGEIIGDSN
ncbi:methionyl-tRNA formyltransferase [[Leptolyngbya] sp. PCC 7376]|uniref:methionyl-tRNA formyltransferase n=1 Tax=[Leptolyngbya] sp. PCC 7376 TaxID=111781 RepID=UPI00029F09F1|nr:methionyl-tRNA formyltransferase [[Leptolyngbya] sp. PCC 7376]AFY39375.1 methionyl-tRNA formyltransferase [[Leptolyngbya] sp. PCC 7376]